MIRSFPAKQLLRYSFCAFLPSKGKRFSSEICNMPGRYSLAAILKTLYSEFGTGGLLRGDAILFGRVFILACVNDVLLGKFPVLQMTFGAVICFFYVTRWMTVCRMLSW